MEHRIYAQSDVRLSREDLEELARLLIKAGFKVHIGKEKCDGSKVFTYYVAYEEVNTKH